MFKSKYSVHDIKQLVGLSERTVRRWTEAGLIFGNPVKNSDEFTYDVQALDAFRRVREMRARGLTIKQIELELQGQMSLFGVEGYNAEPPNGFTTNYDLFLERIVSTGDVMIPDSEGPNNVGCLPRDAEYILYLLLPGDERDFVIGDLTEDYERVLRRFGKPRADVWLYKQILGSIWPLLKRAVLKAGALVWLGRILRRLIS